MMEDAPEQHTHRRQCNHKHVRKTHLNAPKSVSLMLISSRVVKNFTSLSNANIFAANFDGHQSPPMKCICFCVCLASIRRRCCCCVATIKSQTADNWTGAIKIKTHTHTHTYGLVPDMQIFASSTHHVNYILLHSLFTWPTKYGWKNENRGYFSTINHNINCTSDRIRRIKRLSEINANAIECTKWERRRNNNNNNNNLPTNKWNVRRRE